MADGTDQPGIFGTTLAVTVLGLNQWRVVRKKEGNMLISAIWDLSATARPSPTTSRGIGRMARRAISYKYARTDGASGFAGTWESINEQVNSTFEDNGLSFVTLAQKMKKSIQFDGKDYAGQGPNLPTGYATPGRRVSGRAVELADKIDGNLLDTQQVEVSPDGTALTITTHIPGQAKPNIQVFDRE